MLDFPFWDYALSNIADGVRLDGRLTLSPGFCADIPTDFRHSNVVARTLPTTTIRVSEVEVCWNSASNVTYQLQYRPALNTTQWFNLGSPRPGTGSNDCVSDKVQPDQPKRFYRVVPTP